MAKMNERQIRADERQHIAELLKSSAATNRSADPVRADVMRSIADALVTPPEELVTYGLKVLLEESILPGDAKKA